MSRSTGLKAVFRREFQGYFSSPLGYIFIVIFLVASGYLTVSRDFGRFLELRQASLDPFFSAIPWIFVVLVPAVAMRLWSEERKTGSVELLLTLPITILTLGLFYLVVNGIAFALAAQDTVKNFFGSVTVLLDRPFQVGDWVVVGGVDGTVEEVGLRSFRMRTLDQTIITVPNGDFAQMQLENLTDRDRVLIREELCLRYETTQEQLRQVLTYLQILLGEHPSTRNGRTRSPSPRC